MSRQQVKRTTLDGRVLMMPDHFLFLLLTIVLLNGCSIQHQGIDPCVEKLSAALQSALPDILDDSTRISVTVILHDTTDVARVFPMLSISNSKVALGHLTKKEISSLCKHQDVQYIDIPRMRFPNK